MVDFKTLKAEIVSGNYRPIYLLMGKEPYYIDEISKIFEADKSYEQTIFYGKDVTSIDVIHEAGQISMFADKRLVILKEAQDLGKKDGKKADINNLTPYAEHLNNRTVLVICYKYDSLAKTSKLVKAVEKVGSVFETPQVYESQLPAWIKTYVQSQNLEIEERAVALLAEAVGTNLSAVVASVEKLKSVTNGEKLTKITSKLVSDCIGINNEYNILEFVDAILAHNIQKVNKIVKVFCNNQKDYPMPMITSSLFPVFQKLFTYHYLTDKSDASVAKALAINPYVAKIKYVPAAKIYNARKCMINISVIRDFDMKSKGYASSSTSTAELLPLLVYKLLN